MGTYVRMIATEMHAEEIAKFLNPQSNAQGVIA